MSTSVIVAPERLATAGMNQVHLAMQLQVAVALVSLEVVAELVVGIAVAVRLHVLAPKDLACDAGPPQLAGSLSEEPQQAFIASPGLFGLFRAVGGLGQEEEFLGIRPVLESSDVLFYAVATDAQAAGDLLDRDALPVETLDLLDFVHGNGFCDMAPWFREQ